MLDHSVRKTLRCRSINANNTEQSERRKSRRHSTGNTHLPQHTVLPSAVPNSPMYQTVDEDSSGSANSGKSNEVFGITRMSFPHENAGVTPGLRRRRERAERQKSFMREQKQALPAALQLFNAKDDVNNHGNYTSYLFCSSFLLILCAFVTFVFLLFVNLMEFKNSNAFLVLNFIAHW